MTDKKKGGKETRKEGKRERERETQGGAGSWQPHTLSPIIAKKIME